MKPMDISAIEMIAREKNLSFDTVLEAMESAMANAYKRTHDTDHARVVINRATGEVTVFAQSVDDEGNLLDEWVDTPEDPGGRMIAMTVKQVLTQRLREAEREQTVGEYAGKEGDLVTGTIQLHDNRTVVFDLGNAEAILPYGEQVPTEYYQHGARIRAIVTEVRRMGKGPAIIVSRTHPDLVTALFRLEVPEIESGLVTIKAVAREAGHRTKIAVQSQDPAVDPVGACVGPRGQRVRAIVDALSQEKIDIITWSEEPAQLVANALSPAKVREVYLYPDEQLAIVIVPDYQLPLAIGREGQNARLAHRLTKWKIDIKSETQFAEEQAAAQAWLDEQGAEGNTEVELPVADVESHVDGPDLAEDAGDPLVQDVPVASEEPTDADPVESGDASDLPEDTESA